MDTTGAAIIDEGLWLHGGLEQWRRTTGVLRAHLASLPFSAFVDPRDATRLLELAELARHAPASAEVRLGYWQSRVWARVELSTWTPIGRAAITVRALEPLSISAWWLPSAAFAECPPPPRTCTA